MLKINFMLLSNLQIGSKMLEYMLGAWGSQSEECRACALHAKFASQQ